MNNSQAYSGQQGCVTIPDRKCKSNTPEPEWVNGKPLVSKFLFNITDVEHLRRGSDWAATNDPEQLYTAFRIIECEPADTGKCVIKKEYSHVKFINAGIDLEKGLIYHLDSTGDDEAQPKLKLTGAMLLTFLRSFLEFIVWLKGAHATGFSHNDIKADNFCFDGSRVRLIDFSDRSHTVWDAVLKSAGLGGTIITFKNSNWALQNKDIERIRADVLEQVLEGILKPHKMSLEYVKAYKLAKHVFNEAVKGNTPEAKYNAVNAQIQSFLKILIHRLSLLKPEEFFAVKDVDYRELFSGRKLSPKNFLNRSPAALELKKRVFAEAFMQTWTEEEEMLFRAEVALPSGGSRKTRRRKGLRRRRATLYK